MKKNFKNFAEKSFLLSVGIASIAKEKAEKLVNELIKKGKLNEKQGRKLVIGLLKKSKLERKKLKNTIKKAIKRQIPKKRKR